MPQECDVVHRRRNISSQARVLDEPEIFISPSVLVNRRSLDLLHQVIEAETRRSQVQELMSASSS